VLETTLENTLSET